MRYSSTSQRQDGDILTIEYCTSCKKYQDEAYFCPDCGTAMCTVCGGNTIEVQRVWSEGEWKPVPKLVEWD